jgi:hypothetical protein
MYLSDVVDCNTLLCKLDNLNVNLGQTENISYFKTDEVNIFLLFSVLGLALVGHATVFILTLCLHKLRRCVLINLFKCILV